MKQDVLRILNMVKEGKLSPDDAYELMDAFASFEGSDNGDQPPPPPGDKKTDEPFRKLIDGMERLTKDTFGSVDWTRVAEQVKSATKKGVDAVRESVETLSKGEWSMPWFGPSESKTVELPIHVEAGKTIRLERTNGDVVVEGGHALGKLVATAHMRGKDKEDAMRKAELWTPFIEEHDGGLTLNQSDSAQSEDIVLHIPTGVRLDIRIANGDVRTSGTDASVRIESKNGDVSVTGAKEAVEVKSLAGDVFIKEADAGTIEIENKSGDVVLERVSGSLQIRSAAGDVLVKSASTQRANVETVSGDLAIDLVAPVTGSVVARTVSGDVSITIDEQSSAKVSLSSLGGSASSKIELSNEDHTWESLKGTLGSGEGSIEATAVTGDIRLAVRQSD